MNKKTTLIVILLLSIAGRVLGDTASGEAVHCRQLIGAVRPPSEDDERGARYLDDADRAYRDCRDGRLPLDVRVNALRMYGIASEIRGRSQAAIGAYKEALGLLDRAEANHRAMLIEVLDQAASVETRAGLRSDATAHSKQALDERGKQYGSTSAEVSTGMVTLAMVHASFGEYEQSEKLLRQGVRVAEKVCPQPECDALAFAYSGMQTFYDLVGKSSEARKYAELAQEAIPSRRRGGSKE
jgi:tetratricopeptide (TPR) repeat protein